MIQLWREKAEQRFAEIGHPAPKQEAFQYLPFAKLQLPACASIPVLRSIEPYRLAEFAHCLVFVDGFFSHELSSYPQDVVCLPLDQAFGSYGSFLQNRWSKSVREEKDPFALLNGANHGLGAFVYIPPHAKIKLHILHVFTSDALASPRLEMSLGKQADVTLVQTVAVEHAHVCSNGAIDLALGEGAQIRFFDIQLWGASSRSFASVRATLKRDAKFEAMTVTNGAAVVRSRFAVELAEENSFSLLRGLAMLTDERQAHVHAVVDHVAPHCTSRQHFKTVLAGQSSVSFDGKIFVRPAAQKTMAYQLNNNLLLSDQARANSKPNLEIFADDVKASHGSTVTQLSEEELFYFRSRGLSAQEARFLLAHGFCKELLDAIDVASVRPQLFDVMKRVLAHAL